MTRFAGTVGPLLLAVFLANACGVEAPEGSTSAGETQTARSVTLVTGFSESEAVRHDPVADVYLVANINGEPTDADDNGFISRVSPDGEILDLRWIDGAAGDFTLNGPKGMALKDNLLLVADINVVRGFDRETGEHVADWPVEGAAFLNDLAVTADGVVYATDTGTGTLHRQTESGWASVISGEDFGSPNGVDVDAEGVVVVLWNGGAKRVDTMTGETMDLPAPDGERLDGIVLMSDGSYIVSSWDAEAVLRVRADGTIEEVLGSVPEAADIGYDAIRNRILVPTFSNELHIVPLG